jgi:hypothetical protein
MLDSIKAFFSTKLGKLLAIFLLSGLISVATQIGCKPCNTLLSSLLTTVESTETTSTASTATTTVTTTATTTEAAPAAAQ